jgi:hypothetical protein
MWVIVLLISALLWISAHNGASSAIVLDFEDVGRDSCFSFLSDPVFTEGFLLRDSKPGSSLFTCNAASDPRGLATNGTRTLLTRNVVIRHADGAPFDLLSFDVGEESLAYSPYREVLVVGRTQAGEMVLAEFVTDGLYDDGGGIADFETFSLPDEFSDLASVQISDVIGETFFLDNIAIFVLPEHDDPDGDGLRNWEDNCPDVANPGQGDADADGVGDACNDDQDLDADEWANHLDNCRLTANPDQTDVDSDGVGDACDNCPLIENPDQVDDHPANGVGDGCEDTDGDGLTNLDEIALHGSDPFDSDSDADGLEDGEEVDVYGSDPAESDTDGDGVGDGEEIALFGTSPVDFNQLWVLNGNQKTRFGSLSQRRRTSGRLLL